MDGIGGTTQKRILGAKASGQVELRGGFQPNGAGAISVLRGPFRGFTVAYSATGIYTVTLNPLLSGKLSLPTADLPMIVPFGQSVDVTNTNRFECFSVGGYVNATKSFVIQAWQDTAVFQVPQNALNWIDFVIYASTRA